MHAPLSPAARLDQELDAARALLDLLTQEQAQLVTGNIDSLNTITGQKAAAVTSMAELAKSRHRALAAAGFPGEEAGMQAWLKRPGSSVESGTAAAGKSWLELLALAQSAKQLNRTNGVLINTHMLRNQAALNILHGNPPGDNLYGPDGQSSTKAAARGMVVG